MSRMISTSKKYSVEWLAFGIIFMIFFAEPRFSWTIGSAGNLEQWVNLTNTIFYGNQDFLFSYGPLYWLTGGTTIAYDIHTYWISIVFISAVQAFFWATIISLSFRNRGYILLGLAYYLFFDMDLALRCAYFLWPLALVAYLEFRKRSRYG
ncbi:hypothetical protein BZM26_27075 [Paraburkholderia strydomiana]|nr:hypothetical protein BZM26_27075 [Paraburkholderia strydomiana]